MSRKVQLICLALLGVLTVALVIGALPGVRGTASVTAAPVRPASPASSATPLATPTTTTASATPTPKPTPKPTTAAPTKGLAGLAALLDGDRPVSILVLGDGSGDENDEWVRAWSLKQLAASRDVTYRSWNSATGRWRAASPDGGAGAVTVWNGSRRAPGLDGEPARVASIWRPADVVILSYGHRKVAAGLNSRLTAIKNAVLKQNRKANIIVMIQNPDPPASAATQLATTNAVRAWAASARLETVDIYSAFMRSPATRTQLVERDGSPTPLGSRLWARAFQDAIKAAG